MSISMMQLLNHGLLLPVECGCIMFVNSTELGVRMSDSTSKNVRL